MRRAGRELVEVSRKSVEFSSKSVEISKGRPRVTEVLFKRNSAHPASHVTLWLSSGKFASGSDFKGGTFFLKGGAFFA